ncbi:helicase-related protein [Oceanithermus sp.]
MQDNLAVIAYKPGAVVRARGRLWRVLEEADDFFLRVESLDGASRTLLYLPRERDAIRHESSPEPRPVLPRDPEQHRLYLEVEHLRTLQADAPFLSLQRSRVVPHSYQLVPLLMALESPARVRLLIADDVGLGKTIEAGLIVKELLLRGFARRVLVLTPAHLKEDWAEAFSRFFHLHFSVFSPQLLRQLPPGKNPWQQHERLIASIDLAKRAEHRDQVLAQPWDLVVVDEAHLASRVQGRNERHRLVRGLAERAEHLLLVTATPHSGHPESFVSLIQHLDPDGQLGLVTGDAVNRSRARRHVVQRTRNDVLKWYDAEGKRSPFPERDTRPVPVEPSKNEASLFALLSEYARLLMGQNSSTPAQWLAMHFMRRASSSPLALYQSLTNRIERLSALSQEPALDEAAEPDLGPLVDRPDERGGEESADRAYDVAWVEQVRIKTELGYLTGLQEALKARARRPDSKFKRLVEMLSGELAGKKAIVFTRYRDTLEYLGNLLPKRLEGVPVFTLHGGHTEAERDDILDRFARAERAVLVATDVISEGLNLQYHASQVVHYELPWNPNRLEQRNGRVDRFGQPEPVVRVRMLFYERSLDALIFRRLIDKALRIKEEFGVVPNYFGDEEYVKGVVESIFQEEGFLPRSQQVGLFEQDEATDAELARRARQEGFYGHSEFQLPDVEQALSQTYGNLTAPERLGSFFARAAAQWGWGFRPEGAKLTVIRRGKPLAGFDPQVGQAVSFDPWLPESDLLKLDLAHPAVEELMERLRARAWSDRAPARTGLVLADVDEPVFLYLFRARFRGPHEVAETLYPEARTSSGAEADPELAERLLTALLAGELEQPAGGHEALLRQAVRLAPGGKAGRQRVLDRLLSERRRLTDKLRRVYGPEVAFVQELTRLEPLGEPEWLALTVFVGGKS